MDAASICTILSSDPDTRLDAFVVSNADITMTPSIFPTSREPVPKVGGRPVAEFLFRLTRMLEDASNQHLIQWDEGRIVVFDPPRVESEILAKYFSHSKYSSFQRQLNYFGFRKISGKGKMSPCSYINDAASGDISCLLLIRRQTAINALKRREQEAKVATSSSKSSRKNKNTRYRSKSA